MKVRRKEKRIHHILTVFVEELDRYFNKKF